MLRLRATLLARIRTFFSRHDVLEVDTPALSGAATTDPALHSFATTYHGPGPRAGASCYLQTSPEFPMKRLLAAGAGSIYQVCKVFRDGEYGSLHNPEFSLLEWYRTGYDHLDLMAEVERLLREILEDIKPLSGVEHWAYRDLFLEFTGVDPFSITVPELQDLLSSRHDIAPVGLPAGEIDPWLDLMLTHVIEPQLGTGLVFVRDYPASQAALARLLRRVSRYTSTASNSRTDFMNLPMPTNSGNVSRQSAGAVLNRMTRRFALMSACSRHWNQGCLSVPAWRWDSTGCCWSPAEGGACMTLSRFLSRGPELRPWLVFGHHIFETGGMAGTVMYFITARARPRLMCLQ